MLFVPGEVRTGYAKCCSRGETLEKSNNEINAKNKENKNEDNFGLIGFQEINPEKNNLRTWEKRTKLLLIECGSGIIEPKISVCERKGR